MLNIFKVYISGELPIYCGWLFMKVNNILKFKQSKDNKTSGTKDIMTKLQVHNHTMVIYTLFKFISEIPSIVTKENHKNEGNQRAITPP